MPVWSLAAPFVDGDTSMNIVTFATPVSVAPPKLWIVSLYRNTKTRQAFLEYGEGVLQLLTPSHKHLVPLLGKRSGYEEGYSKREACQEIGLDWVGGNEMDLLPACASYIQLKLLSTSDAGDHEIALCQVTGTGVWDGANVVQCDDATATTPLDPTTALYTAQLRDEGIL